MSETIVYSLEKPFQFTASRYVESLTFRSELKVRDYKRMDQVEGGVGREIMLLALLCGEPMELIEALDMRDFMGIREATLPFVRHLHRIGEP
jgi:hypothetical protein